MCEQNNRLAVVVCAPSGAGKSTVISTMLAQYGGLLPPVFLSVSDTTRAPRPCEQSGVSYHYISRDAFDRGIAENRYLEWADYAGNRYGTPREPVEEKLANNQVVILEIDVQGARQIKSSFPGAIFVFLVVRDFHELEKRLRLRDTETEQSIQRRMAAARHELLALDEFDYVVFNDEIDAAAFELASIIKGTLCLRERRKQIIHII